MVPENVLGTAGMTVERRRGYLNVVCPYWCRKHWQNVMLAHRDAHRLILLMLMILLSLLPCPLSQQTSKA